MDAIVGENRGRGRRRVRKASTAAVKLADVARLAGVSTASVSRALNAPATVSPDLRDRVRAAAKQLNWIPNGAAKALASLRSRTVGALIPSLWHQNFATMVDCLQDELTGAGYTLLLGCSGFSLEREAEQAAKMIERGVECLVLIGEYHSPALFDAIDAHRVAYLVTYTTGREAKHVCVGFDNYAAFTRIVEHLLELGHRRFGILAQESSENDRIQQRIEAARDVLAREGIAVRPQHFVSAGNWTMSAGRDAFRKLLGSDPFPTALICTNDYLAAGALIEAKAAGIKVPEELSVSGFDDIDWAAHMEPAITTVRVPDQQMGREAARYVIDVIEGRTPNPPQRIEAELIIRSSTTRPKS